MSKKIIISGLAGAGSNTALDALEDRGYFAIDNFPFFLLDKLLAESESGSFAENSLAIVVDCRDPEFPPPAHRLMEYKEKYSMEIIFLEADEISLIKRFSEHRRRHPLGQKNSLQDAIAQEKRRLAPVKDIADLVINTSNLSPLQLQRRLADYLKGDCLPGDLKINLVSFGYKHGIPPEADIIWDVRFLPNPHYQERLRSYTGQQPEVAEYVLGNESAAYFLDRLESLLMDLLPRYQQSGKAQLTIALGCTGGRHRSVAVTEELHSFLSRHFNNLTIAHRDMDRE